MIDIYFRGKQILVVMDAGGGVSFKTCSLLQIHEIINVTREKDSAAWWKRNNNH